MYSERLLFKKQVTFLLDLNSFINLCEILTDLHFKYKFATMILLYGTPRTPE